MSRTAVRRLFYGLLLYLPLQYAAVGVIGADGLEPWPAVVFPGFQRVLAADDVVVVAEPRIEAVRPDGRVDPVPVARVLAALPVSHHGGFMRLQCRPGAGAPTPACARPEAAGWWRERLAAAAPGPLATARVVWGDRHFRPRDGATWYVGLDTLHLPLSDVARR